MNKRIATIFVTVLVVLSVSTFASCNNKKVVENMYNHESLEFASMLCSGDGNGSGGISCTSMGEADDMVLAGDIFYCATEFDEDCGNTDAHLAEENREKWYLVIKNNLENSKDGDDQRKYALRDISFQSSFERIWHELPDKDGDGTPDCEDVVPDDSSKDARLLPSDALKRFKE